MWLVAAMETRDYLHIAQIIVMVLIGIPAYLAWFMLRTHRSVLKLNAMANRHQLFLTLTDTFSADMFEASMLHAHDNFDMKVFEERYKGQPKRIQSYLLMKRKYLYIMYSSLVDKMIPVQNKKIAEMWIKELGEFHEFHDVHARHGRYYPEFAVEVDTLLAGNNPSGWMCLTE